MAATTVLLLLLSGGIANCIEPPCSNAFLAAGGAGLLMHLIVRQYEPNHHTSHMLGVAFGPPAIIAYYIFGPLVMSPISAFFVCFAIYILHLAIATIAYRVSPFHPLAKFPGPLGARMSKFYMVSKAKKGKQHLYYKALHDKYGDFVRIGPNEVSARSVDAVIPVLGASGLPKGPVWDGRSTISKDPRNRPLIALRDHDLHAERRKLWNKGFSSPALKDYEEIIQRRGKQLVEALEARKARVDIAGWCGFFTFDFMGDMAFGGGFELMRDGGDTEGVWEILENVLRPVMLMAHIPWIVPFIRMLSFANKKSIKMRDFAKSRAIKRSTEGSLSKDLWHHLFEVDPSKASLGFMTQEAVLAIVAGADTTSVVLAAVCFFMCEEPEYLKRLQAEIEEIFPRWEEPFDSLKLSQMPLLNAMLNEAMRLMPATPSGAQRAVLPGMGGKMIGTHFLPEHTNIFINNFALHRDPRCFFPQPEFFWPDRWLEPSKRHFPARLFGSAPDVQAINDSVILNQTAFLPFSFGPASCVGKNLALQEMRVIVSLIAQKFDIKFAEGYDPNQWWEDAKDWYLWQIGALPVQLTSRF